MTVTYEMRTIQLGAVSLFWCAIFAGHLMLAILATILASRRKEGRVGVHVAAAWLIPQIGPAVVCWRFRPAPQPPLL